MWINLSPGRKATLFYSLTVGLCVLVAVLLRSAGETAAVVAMLAPITALVLMQFVITRDGYHRAGWRSLGLTRSGFQVWPIAVAIPLAVLAGSEMVTGLTGLTRFDSSGLPAPLDLPIELAVLIVFSFFEEIGWRGYFLPLVNRAWGQRDGAGPALLVGLLHGLFHLPVVFIVTGAYLTEGNRWLTVPIFLAVMTTAGALYGWLRYRSDSVWPAVITHAVFDLGLTIVEDAWPGTRPGTLALVGRETGIATLALLVLTALVLYQGRPTSTVPSVATSEVTTGTRH